MGRTELMVEFPGCTAPDFALRMHGAQALAKVAPSSISNKHWATLFAKVFESLTHAH